MTLDSGVAQPDLLEEKVKPTIDNQFHSASQALDFKISAFITKFQEMTSDMLNNYTVGTREIVKPLTYEFSEALGQFKESCDARLVAIEASLATLPRSSPLPAAELGGCPEVSHLIPAAPGSWLNADAPVFVPSQLFAEGSRGDSSLRDPRIVAGIGSSSPPRLHSSASESLSPRSSAAPAPDEPVWHDPILFLDPRDVAALTPVSRKERAFAEQVVALARLNWEACGSPSPTRLTS